MSSTADRPTLASLEFLPYIDANGELPAHLQDQVGIYAIFDREQNLQFVGYSRDIYLSLKQHLVRLPERCYWLKVATIERPNRTWLETARAAWIEENGNVPSGDDASWTEPIDTSSAMTEIERDRLENLDEMGQIKLRKQVARRVEETIVNKLQERGVKTEVRFNPKLKERGLLDLK